MCTIHLLAASQSVSKQQIQLRVVINNSLPLTRYFPDMTHLSILCLNFTNEQKFVKMRCAVYGYNTNNRSKNNFKFFGFPKDYKLKAKWRHLCKPEDTFNINNARICSNHFVDEDYERNLRYELFGYQPKRFRSLKKEAVPSKNLPNREKIRARLIEYNGRKKGRTSNSERKDYVTNTKIVVYQDYSVRRFPPPEKCCFMLELRPHFIIEMKCALVV
ncbi:hypothetical protein NQ318_014517 [Aromia moschata]|uniref:THAP-type domain-containing protein n=1 Tax=Aromia moschata TaxID=1265417 RepID=A0AAV8YP26_9CUCU|nr:hypothetical protein NQ318_014517 [Aromia moschata]